MVDRPSARSARTVLVLDENLRSAARWFDQLHSSYAVLTVSSLAGASVAIDGQDVVAIVIMLVETSTPPRLVASSLRGHPLLARTPIFAISDQVELVAAELLGLAQVEVLTPEQADYELTLRVASAASRVSSRPAPRRASSPQLSPVQRSEPLARFGQDCAERAERGLVLSELLSGREAAPFDRRRASDELAQLFGAIRGDALQLQLGELASVVGMAELAVHRLPAPTGPIVVPRGIAGLLADLRDLSAGAEAVQQFDAELHRSRLTSLQGEPRRPSSP